jgi:hypothetical protein
MKLQHQLLGGVCVAILINEIIEADIRSARDKLDALRRRALSDNPPSMAEMNSAIVYAQQCERQAFIQKNFYAPVPFIGGVPFRDVAAGYVAHCQREKLSLGAFV